MASTAAIDNTIPPTQSAQLASLANATEPQRSPSHQPKAPVGTFPQRKAEVPPAAGNASPFGNFASGQNAQFSSTNPPRFSFAQNMPVNNGAPFTFNSQTANPPLQQPIPPMTFVPSKPRQEMTNNPPQQHFTTTFNMSTLSTNIPNSASVVPQQPSGLVGEESEAPETATSAADLALLDKKINTKLRDPNALVIDRSDPTSPLYSLKSFEDLHLRPELLKGIYSMGFQKPSKIQEIALPHLLGNPPRNIIAQSQSGTGKTAAFSLALLSRIDPSKSYAQALILSPTYELAIQIGSVIERMAKFLPYIKLAYAVRNSSTQVKRNQLLTEPIVIGTPGTVEEWCRRQRVIDLQKLHICCVDEADVMIATENFQDLCVNVVNNLDPVACQIMLFSATYSDEVMNFARRIVSNPIVLRLKREKQALTNIRQLFIRCYDPEQKYNAIEQIYMHMLVGQAMVFCRTKATAHDLATRMANEQHSVRVLTSALDIDQRASIIRGFRDRIFNVLISTNVTARGIDIDDVSLVVNYDMPVTTEFKPDFETYLHRIGRCGRFGKLGYTFNLISSAKDFEVMKAIEEYFQHPIHEITIQDINSLEQSSEEDQLS